MTADPSAVLSGWRELLSERDEALAWVARASADGGELDAAAGAFEVVQDKIAARASRLLAAVEAGLKLHQSVDRGTGPQCKGCATHVTFTRWPCTTYEAIRAALTAEEAGDAS